MSLNRRGFVLSSALTAAWLLSGGARSAAAAGAGPAEIVARYRELQVGRGRRSPERDQAVAALDELAETFDATMDIGSDQLWDDLPTGPGSTYFPKMYYRLRVIAVAWATPGSALSDRPELPQRVRTALDTLYRVQYNENTAEEGNWYVYEIGVPLWLLQIIAVLGEQLTPEQQRRYLRPVLRFVADPNRRAKDPATVETGANRSDKALIAVVSGAMLGDLARIQLGIDAVTDVAGGGAASLVSRVTAGDGFHTDGSFLQHEVVPYAGHYALVLLTSLSGLMALTQGTEWELATEVREAGCAALIDACAPFVFAGSMMESVRGRFLSRQGETAHDAGHQLTAAAVLFARTAPEPVRSRLAGLAASWIESGTWAPYLEVSGLDRFSGGLHPVGVAEVEYAQELLAANPQRPEVAAVHRVFGQQDRLVHVTEDWSASLGIGSSRICRYESINEMNLHGWYTGDGVLYVFLPQDQGHYSDAYWPTVDATLLPGTTTKDSTPPELESTPLAPRDFAGGARYDDRFGAHGLDFVSQDGTLTARKSWFFTPEGVVCLGAGITDGTPAAVRTTVENRNLGENGQGALLADGVPVPGQAELNSPGWLHLEGVGGYVFLAESAVRAVREDRTGSWRDVDQGANTGGTTNPYTRRYQKILIEHGAQPADASYAYAVLPGASAAATIAARASWQLRVNDPVVQAIRLWRNDVLLANFFAAGAADEVAVSGPASLVLGRAGRERRLAVADPTQRQEVVRVTLRGAAGMPVIAAPGTAEVVSANGDLVIDVQVAGALGATRVLTIG
ncbi:polysaccharide lyase 8 family protein [Saccharopolyspora sp. K220]|uniref:polysaccharide lyase 8 family protein n=1 Tax=Saccharopolyspora soli TaxID=2926618 RepID=UPI001F5A1C1F|nr:polysaccharide lyase 8 family protein [Saccharopolyspora soli]MCI2421725.1 polysaccharide lyase 8 family protein [Saccharopolyspora soli]